MKPLRVLLADDHPLMRAGVRSLLAAIGGIEVVAEACDGHEALVLAKQHRPHVVLLDIAMPGLNGIDVTARLTQEYPQTRVLILSSHSNEQYVRRAFQAGARGYILKDAEPAELQRALAAVARGDIYLSPSVTGHVVTGLAHGPEPESRSLDRLTPRQREVLQLVAEGYRTKEIARKLGISTRTVENHRAQIMELLGIHDVVGLVHYAIRAGLIHPER